MRVEELAKRLKKVEKSRQYEKEKLVIFITGGNKERVIEVPLGKPTRKY